MKTSITFKEFLSLHEQDLQADTENLRQRIATIDNNITQRTSFLKKQKETLEKMLAQKERESMIKDRQKPDERRTDTVPTATTVFSTGTQQ